MMKRATVVNCKRMGIRKDPCVTRHMEEIIVTVPAGTVIDVDPSEVYYSWNDKEFYKVSYGSYNGYALISCLETKESKNGKHSAVD